MEIPSDDEIRALHERFAPSPAAFYLVWTHCRIVAAIAAQLLPAGADPALVRAGALLHDIGVHRLGPGDAYIRHGLLGHELLRTAGLPEELCRFCSCHTGVGITRADIVTQHLPLPPGDYVARTEEERLVMYADKFHSKTTPPVLLSAATYSRSVARFGPDKVAAFTALITRYGEPDLRGLAAEHGHAIT
ncbi:HD domain-containing protein [Symbioplanes lichenis]|uniref:HD domain-containing protein n=1 Tax=Symbioplanes lichenis TaxID=1629072 RepID=UPI0027398FA0|nr:HD domain-containing protein [Actinoplanes lichenis]